MFTEKMAKEDHETKQPVDLLSQGQEVLPTSPLEVAQWIKDSQEVTKYGSDIVAVAMDLPPSPRIGHENLLKALEIVLRDFFIELPEEVASNIKAGELDVFEFVAPAQEKHLRPRNVEINTLPGISTLTIKGVEPIDGEDGYFELFFDFKIKPGKVLPDGTIDFREVNRFPQASKDQLLMRIYEPTLGYYGTDIYGFPIKSQPGKAASVKIKEGLYPKNGFSDEAKRAFKDYYSKKAGIIICEFSGAPEVQNLQEISIKNKIVVKDIDFTTGNIKGDANELRCKANLIVEGDIRGCFSVVIDGSLTVKGAVEGETIDATGPVIVNFAKNYVRSGTDMEVGIARNASITAENKMHIKKELSDATARAKEIILSPKGVPELLLGKSEIFTNKLIAEDLNIRNIVELTIGEALFKTLEQLKLQKEELETEFAKYMDLLKSRGAIFGEKLKLAQSFVDEKQKKLLPVLKQFATMILLGNLSFEKINARMTNIENTLGSELKMLTKHLRAMVDAQEQLHKIREKLDTLKSHIDEVEAEIEQINIDIKGNMAEAGQIRLKCNGFEKTWTRKDLKGKNFQLIMSYDLQAGPKIKFFDI